MLFRSQSTDEATVQMEYDDVNRLIKYNGKQVKYDTDGNMIYGPLDGEMATFTYDCRNRLIKVNIDSGETTEYSYDAENVRTKVIKHAGTDAETITTYVTDLVSNELSRVLEAETVDKNGNVETILYTYGNGLIAQESIEKDESEEALTQEYLVYHFNNIGSTTAVTDESGAIKSTYTYSIYGKLLSGNYGEIVFLYNGQYGVMSDDNGLYYMRSRYYNIDIKRFINQDILKGSIDSSQSLNRYVYVEGNPVSYLDPFGLSKDMYDGLHNNVDGFNFWVSMYSVSIGWVNITPIGNVVSVGTTALHSGAYLYDFGLCISEAWQMAFESRWSELDEAYSRMRNDAGQTISGIVIFAIDFFITRGILGWMSDMKATQDGLEKGYYMY